MRAVGRIVSACAAFGSAALWVLFLFGNPYAPRAQGRALTFGGLMMVSALVSAAVAARGAHLGMYLLFFVSFFPVGMAAMSGPGLFSLIGWLNLLYLAGGVLVHLGVLQAKRKRAG
jgi:hypothetical protein